jgi:hypothetical protein
MRFLKWPVGRAKKKTQNTSTVEPISLAAFGQMNSSQQSMFADALVAHQKERQGFKRAS